MGTKDTDTWALASIRAFSDVIDAVETAGRSILTGHHSPMLLSGVKYWNFNKSGLVLLLRAAATSAVIHVRRSSAGRDFGCLKSEGTGVSCMSSRDSVEKPMEACGLWLCELEKTQVIWYFHEWNRSCVRLIEIGIWFSVLTILTLVEVGWPHICFLFYWAVGLWEVRGLVLCNGRVWSSPDRSSDSVWFERQNNNFTV